MAKKPIDELGRTTLEWPEYQRQANILLQDVPKGTPWQEYLADELGSGFWDYEGNKEIYGFNRTTNKKTGKWTIKRKRATVRAANLASAGAVRLAYLKAANEGCLILGICNGFQILTETGLLKGVLLRNKNLKFINKDINIKVINNNTKFSKKYKKNQILKINIAHNEGNYFTNSDHLNELKNENLIAFKYCDKDGNVDESTNPNGSLENIAGIFNSKKNILGMMPHPERMVDDLISNTDGVNLFSSLIN